MNSNLHLSIETMARAWNRGAALSFKDLNGRFDHIIPVMLAQPSTETAFGRMFDPWSSEEIAEGCRLTSFILINLKNHA